MNSTEDYIDKLIKKFFDVTISNDEMKYLYSYFLKLKTIPEKWKIEGIIIQEFAIKHYCFTHKEEFENQFARWIKEEQQQKNKRILKYTYRIAASILILLTVATGIYFVADNNSPQHNQYAQTNTIPTQSVPQPTHRQDHKPATITDNEIKNTANQTADRHNYTMHAEHKTATLPTADAPQPDIMATTPVAQEPVSVLLAETETQIEIEQNFVAIDTTDTILQLQKDLLKYETNYLAYADTANNNNHIPDISNKTINEELCSLNMITYCNIRCNSDNVTEIIINNLMIV